jgi:hypothetical protein
MTKVTFYGSPAWVGAIHGPTICDFWNSDPAQLNWDRSLLNTVDLAKTPSAALAGRIKPAQIEVDDHTGNGGRTTIGPLWPNGTQIGACWISDQLISKATNKARPMVANGNAYEYMTIQYFDGEQHNRRFHGFHANVLQVNGGLSLVQIWSPGTGNTGVAPAGTWWLDLTANAEPSTPALTANRPGALFLEIATVRQMTTFDVKLPRAQGAVAL